VLGAAVWCMLYTAVLLLLLLVGRQVNLPYDSRGNLYADGGLVPAVRQLLGRPDIRGFYVDYASAHALTHGKDAYANSSDLFRGLGGPAWAVNGANPHPPTLLIAVLPFTLLSYGPALAAWTLAMVAVFIATLRLVGVRFGYAVAIGVGLALTFPGAYAIGNPVPIIGLGVALAYRYRDNPILAGLGIAVAALPKGSGLILALPFLFAARIRTVISAAVFYAIAALVPLAWQGNVWTRYLDAGLKSINANAHGRADNASLLFLAHSLWGMSYKTTTVLLSLVTIGLVLWQRDLFWPTTWAAVAMLPIAWMYSLLTLVPLVAFAVLRAPRRTAAVAVLAAAVTIGSPPSGQWPTGVFPVVIGLVVAMYVLISPKTSILWFPAPLDRYLPQRLRLQPSIETRDMMRPGIKS
jgi:Glycosyltransferase family 87